MRLTPCPPLLGGAVRHMADAVVVLDLSLRVVEVGGNAEALLGWPAEALLGRFLHLDFEVEHPGGDAGRLREAGPATWARPHRVRLRRQDGRWAELEVVVTRLAEAGEAATGYLAVARDLAPRLGDERAALDGVGRSGGRLDQPGLGLLVGRPGSRFLEVNDAYCALTGWSRRALRGMDWREVTHPDDVPREEALLGRLDRGELAAYALEKRYLRRDGRVIRVHLSLSASPLGDGTRVAVGVVRDLSGPGAAAAARPPAGAMLPICMHCKAVRSRQGEWVRLERYVAEHAGVEVSHGLCPPCAERHYPGL